MFLDDDDLLQAGDARTDCRRRCVAHPEALAATGACRLYTENVGSLKVYHPPRAHTGIIWRELLFGWWANSGQMMSTAPRSSELSAATIRNTSTPRIGSCGSNVACAARCACFRLSPWSIASTPGKSANTTASGVQRQKVWNEFIARLARAAQREARGIRTRRRAGRSSRWKPRESRLRSGRFGCNCARASRRRHCCDLR